MSIGWIILLTCVTFTIALVATNTIVSRDVVERKPGDPVYTFRLTIIWPRAGRRTYTWSFGKRLP